MKKLYVSLLLIIAIIFGGLWNVNKSFAQETEVNDEEYEKYSEAYKRYLQLPEEEKAKLSVIPRKYNVPLDILYEDEQKENTLLSKLQKAAQIARSGLDNDEDEIPVSYILTGQDTNNDGIVDEKDIKVESYGGINIKVENQEKYDTCWAFASINTLETNLALHGYGDYDFSELHLDYMRVIKDNYYGDIGLWTLHGGANFKEFEYYLMTKEGVVLESEVPYTNTYDGPEQIDYLLSLKQRANCKEFVDMPTIDKYSTTYTDEELSVFRNAVKRHILENGALFANINSVDIPKYNNIYVLNTKASLADHAITIIGWDDNFSKDNFPEECRPQKNGAYIALNSWGEEWGHNGIFYISYEDYLVENSMEGVKDGYIVDPFYISIENEPTKVNYLQGETFDITGLIVNANYQDGTSKEVTNYTINPEVLSVDDKEVTIIYQEGDIIQEVKQKINVNSNKIKCGESSYAYYNEKTKYLILEGSGETYDYTSMQENPFSNIEIEKIIINENINKINSLGNISELKELYLLGEECDIVNIDLQSNNIKIYAKNGSNVIEYCSNNGIEYVGYDIYYECGNNAYAFLNLENKNMIITGKGETNDYLVNNLPWKDNIGNIQTVQVDDEITKLGEKLFVNASNLKSVHLGENVITIGKDIFYNDTKLEEIEINSKLTQIGDEAFYNCESLREVAFPNSLNKIGIKSFYNCKSIEFLKIPGSVTRIDNSAFYNCINLKKLEVDYGVEYIWPNAFENCVELNEVILPESIINIYDYAFKNCKNLKYIDLPYGIKYLGQDVFDGSGLVEIDLPDSINGSLYYAFVNCKDLKRIRLSKSISLTGGVFYGCDLLEEVEIPYGVETIIENNNFCDCKSLKQIRFPNSLKSLGRYDFIGCENLEKIILPESINYIEEGGIIDATIYCKGGSYAEEYSINKGYNYIVDNVSPTISNIEIEETESGAKKVMVIAEDDNETVGIGVYSFDGGVTWQEEPYKYFTNTQNIEIIVKDGVGNTSEPQEVQITIDNKLIRLEIVTAPTKTSYIEGQNFNSTGMKIEEVYSDGTAIETDDYVIINGENLYYGQETVTIRSNKNPEIEIAVNISVYTESEILTVKFPDNYLYEQIKNLSNPNEQIKNLSNPRLFDGLILSTDDSTNTVIMNKEVMNEVTELEIRQEVEDLSGLEHFTNLSNINLNKRNSEILKNNEKIELPRYIYQLLTLWNNNGAEAFIYYDTFYYDVDEAKHPYINYQGNKKETNIEIDYENEKAYVILDNKNEEQVPVYNSQRTIVKGGYAGEQIKLDNIRGIEVKIKGTINGPSYIAFYEPYEELEITIQEYIEEQEGETTYLTGIGLNTTLAEIESKIETNGDKKILLGEEEITSEEAVIGTGYILVISNEEETKEYTIIVEGDISGDGIMDDIDLLKLARYKAGLDLTLKTENLKASDLIKDGVYVGDSDLLKMARVLAGLDTIR